MTATGAVDEHTWRLLLPTVALPSLAERCLALTAAFEGHDYTLAVGNFDGAGLTWGIIGFTLKHGEVQKILNEVQQTDPDLLDHCFADRAAQLRAMLAQPLGQQMNWADSVSSQKGLLVEPWRTAFRALGAEPTVQAIQQRLAMEDYFQPSMATAERWGLKSELGIALCFDIHVQNGGISKRAAALVDAKLPEPRLRVAIANAVASCSRAAYQEDVRARKLTVARGTGRVHGAQFDLANWGLGEFPAEIMQAMSAKG